MMMMTWKTEIQVATVTQAGPGSTAATPAGGPAWGAWVMAGPLTHSGGAGGRRIGAATITDQ